MSSENRSKVIKCENFSWDSVPRKTYKEDTTCYRGVHRYGLLGEDPAEQQLNFQTRYFEVEPGGYTSFEMHRHPHSVIVIRGSGEVILGDSLTPLGLHDVVYVAPETPHQFHAGEKEPLGFICVVDRYRDRPELPDREYIERHIRTEEVKKKIKR